MCLYRRRIVRCANCQTNIIDEERVLIERCSSAWTAGTARIHPICLNWRYEDGGQEGDGGGSGGAGAGGEDVVSEDLICSPCYERLQELADKERAERGELALGQDPSAAAAAAEGGGDAAATSGSGEGSAGAATGQGGGEGDRRSGSGSGSGSSGKQYDSDGYSI